MTKRRDTDTLDIFRDYTPTDVAAHIDPDVTKGGSLDVKICRAIKLAMDKYGKSRAVIAEEMTDYLGQRVTENMLDCYASPARKDHKITLERFIALLEVTDCYDLLAFVCNFSGFIAVPARYKDVIDIWREDQEIEARVRRRDTLMARVKGLK